MPLNCFTIELPSIWNSIGTGTAIKMPEFKFNFFAVSMSFAASTGSFRSYGALLPLFLE